MKILETIHLIASDSDWSYVYRIRLGWCIVGPVMDCDSKGLISCHRMTVRDSSTSQVVSLHFGIKDSIKGFTLKEIFRMMYSNDVSELALLLSKIMTSSSEMSVEDRKFLQVLEKETKKKDDHYVVPLPFSDENQVITDFRK